GVAGGLHGRDREQHSEDGHRRDAEPTVAAALGERATPGGALVGDVLVVLVEGLLGDQGQQRRGDPGWETRRGAVGRIRHGGPGVGPAGSAMPDSAYGT